MGPYGTRLRASTPVPSGLCCRSAEPHATPPHPPISFGRRDGWHHTRTKSVRKSKCVTHSRRLSWQSRFENGLRTCSGDWADVLKVGEVRLKSCQQSNVQRKSDSITRCELLSPLRKWGNGEPLSMGTVRMKRDLCDPAFYCGQSTNSIGSESDGRPAASCFCRQ